MLYAEPVIINQLDLEKKKKMKKQKMKKEEEERLKKKKCDLSFCCSTRGGRGCLMSLPSGISGLSFVILSGVILGVTV